MTFNSWRLKMRCESKSELLSRFRIATQRYDEAYREFAQKLSDFAFDRSPYPGPEDTQRLRRLEATMIRLRSELEQFRDRPTGEGAPTGDLELLTGQRGSSRTRAERTGGQAIAVP